MGRLAFIRFDAVASAGTQDELVASGGRAAETVLAAVFDGHRGGKASAFAAAALPEAVRSAIERAIQSAQWRAIESTERAT